ncbi:MAG TPA: hypothetical protein VL484_20580 [Vicinamibacterales bacterium]|jgi:hypothetical protein|nr:hypothetical protein [Vicinamibacterales bacterium]
MTNRTVLSVAVAAIFLCAAVAAQPQPGGPTQARVWIQNHGDGEAIPVTLAGGGRVSVLGPVALDGSTVVGSHTVRQVWEYQTVAIPAGADAGALLKDAGAAGWEAAGIIAPAPNAVVLLKRPR